MRLRLSVVTTLALAFLVAAPIHADESVKSYSPQTSVPLTPPARVAQANSRADSSSAAGLDREVNPSASDRDPGNTHLEEIIVTAQKREERLIDTPQSVSVLSADALSALGASQFRDYASTVPGLSYASNGAGATKLTLRGISTGFDISPSVGIYVDDVPYGPTTTFAIGGVNAIDVGLFDLDRIEVLRGPQGTLYGASSMSGLLKYVTKLPNLERFGVDIQAGLSGTQHGGIGELGGLAVNMPIVPGMAALRLSGFYSHEKGYIDNIALGKDINSSDIYGGRLDLLLTPVDALSIRINGIFQNVARDGEATVDYSFSGHPLFGELAQRRVLAEPFSNNFHLLSGTVKYDFGPASLSSISGYQWVRTVQPTDISAKFVPVFNQFGGPYSAVGFPSWVQTYKFTQELRLASTNKGPLEWLVGGFYNKESSYRRDYFSYYDMNGSLSPTSPNDFFNIFIPTNFQEYAAFGDLTWRISRKFDVTGGLRYARNKQTFRQDGSGLFVRSSPTTRATDDVITYLANARYYLNDHATAYVRYATGYRPGGPNARVTDAAGNLLAPETYKPDKLRSYEFGIKGDRIGGGLGVDLSLYYIDWTDLQILVGRGGFSIPGNAPGGATVKGAELALSESPTSRCNLTGVFAFQDAELSSSNADLGARAGERLPGVPRFTASLSADYVISSSTSAPTLLGVTVRYVSDQTASFDAGTSFPQYRLPDFTAVDLHASVSVASNDLQFYVRNVLDERGQQSALTTSYGTARVAILQPRTIGVLLTRKF
jgi:outer membrane receptor protein involved in Fe transport